MHNIIILALRVYAPTLLDILASYGLFFGFDNYIIFCNYSWNSSGYGMIIKFKIYGHYIWATPLLCMPFSLKSYPFYLCGGGIACKCGCVCSIYVRVCEEAYVFMRRIPHPNCKSSMVAIILLWGGEWSEGIDYSHYFGLTCLKCKL